MASSIALPLTNLLLGVAGFGTSVGFSIAEKKKMEKLQKKSKQLSEDVKTCENLYNHTYYLVAINLHRVTKAMSKLPSDFLKKLEELASTGTSLQPDSKFVEATKTLARMLNISQISVTQAALFIEIARYIVNRQRARNAEQPNEPDVPEQPDPFEGLLLPENVAADLTVRNVTLNNLIKGLNIAGIVFGVANLAISIGSSCSTLAKLNKAISDVEEKQNHMTKFETAMTKALDVIVEHAGLPYDKSYVKLVEMAHEWKKISEYFDSYQKSLYYAIKGYYLKKSYDEIKEMLDKHSDKGAPFPDDAYPLAKALADDIKYLFGQKKTDKEIVQFFATENPKKGRRFVFDEYFINTLRTGW